MTKDRKDDIAKSVLRIGKMERLFDYVTGILRNAPEELRSPSAKEAVQTLSDYYGNGDWLRDYTMDEQGLLPPERKRGVLSQDGLYDLFSEINEITAG